MLKITEMLVFREQEVESEQFLRKQRTSQQLNS